jgi:hypothetical protein
VEAETAQARRGGGMIMAVFRRTRVWLAGLALAVVCSPSIASVPDPLGEFGRWAGWALTEAGGKLCYIYSEPTRSEGDYTRRGDTYVQVTHRTAAKTRNVVSITAGYPYQEQSEVELVIDGDKKFMLFTDGDTAWARDDKTDAAIVQAMRAGRTMVVRGTSARGTLTTDTYSLNGVTAAHNAISKACGVN